MGLTPSASPPSWGLRLPSRRVHAHPAPSSGRRQLPAGRAGRGRTPCRSQVRSQGRLGASAGAGSLPAGPATRLQPDSGPRSPFPGRARQPASPPPVQLRTPTLPTQGPAGAPLRPAS